VIRTDCLPYILQTPISENFSPGASANTSVVEQINPSALSQTAIVLMVIGCISVDPQSVA